jgi:rubredoxin
MALIARMAPYWQCDVCSWEWFADSESGPRQCAKCGSRKWNDGMVKDADLYQQALVVRHLNPYRRPLTARQQAALVRIATMRRAESARKATQSTRRHEERGIIVVPE